MRRKIVLNNTETLEMCSIMYTAEQSLEREYNYTSSFLWAELSVR
jgi:hypothetical protein